MRRTKRSTDGAHSLQPDESLLEEFQQGKKRQIVARRNEAVTPALVSLARAGYLFVRRGSLKIWASQGLGRAHLRDRLHLLFGPSRGEICCTTAAKGHIVRGNGWVVCAKDLALSNPAPPKARSADRW